MRHKKIKQTKTIAPFDKREWTTVIRDMTLISPELGDIGFIGKNFKDKIGTYLPGEKVSHDHFKMSEKSSGLPPSKIIRNSEGVDDGLRVTAIDSTTLNVSPGKCLVSGISTEFPEEVTIDLEDAIDRGLDVINQHTQFMTLNYDTPGDFIYINNINELQRIGNSIHYPLNGNYLLIPDEENVWYDPEDGYTYEAVIDASDTSNWNDGKGFIPIASNPGEYFTGSISAFPFTTIRNLHCAPGPDGGPAALISKSKGAIINGITIIDSIFESHNNCASAVIYHAENTWISGCTIRKCNITSESPLHPVGGFIAIGQDQNNIRCSIADRCTISSKYIVGSLAGLLKNNSTVEHCISNSFIIGEVSELSGAENNNIASGLVGKRTPDPVLSSRDKWLVRPDMEFIQVIETSVFTGTITSPYKTYGITENGENSTVSVYFDVTKNSTTLDSNSSNAKTTAELKNISTYTGSPVPFKNIYFNTSSTIGEHGVDYGTIIPNRVMLFSNNHEDIPLLYQNVSSSFIYLDSIHKLWRIGRDPRYPANAHYIIDSNTELTPDNSVPYVDTYRVTVPFTGKLIGSSSNTPIQFGNDDIFNDGFYLFEENRGIIKNIHIELGGCPIKKDVGIFAKKNYGVISRCTVSGTLYSSSVFNTSNFHTLFSSVASFTIYNYGLISGCSSNLSFSNTGVNYVGSFGGISLVNDGVIQNCVYGSSSLLDINGYIFGSFGGISTYCEYGTITRSMVLNINATVLIHKESQYIDPIINKRIYNNVGMIVGQLGSNRSDMRVNKTYLDHHKKAEISDCSATIAFLNISRYGGGISWDLNEPYSVYEYEHPDHIRYILPVGCIVGSNFGGKVERVYHYGGIDIYDRPPIYGSIIPITPVKLKELTHKKLVGYNDDGNITSSYFTNISSIFNDVGDTWDANLIMDPNGYLPYDEMSDEDEYPEWDFHNIWTMSGFNYDDYPSDNDIPLPRIRYMSYETKNEYNSSNDLDIHMDIDGDGPHILVPMYLMVGIDPDDWFNNVLNRVTDGDPNVNIMQYNLNVFRAVGKFNIFLCPVCRYEELIFRHPNIKNMFCILAMVSVRVDPDNHENPTEYFTTISNDRVTNRRDGIWKRDETLFPHFPNVDIDSETGIKYINGGVIESDGGWLKDWYVGRTSDYEYKPNMSGKPEGAHPFNWDISENYIENFNSNRNPLSTSDTPVYMDGYSGITAYTIGVCAVFYSMTNPPTNLWGVGDSYLYENRWQIYSPNNPTHPLLDLTFTSEMSMLSTNGYKLFDTTFNSNILAYRSTSINLGASNYTLEHSNELFYHKSFIIANSNHLITSAGYAENILFGNFRNTENNDHISYYIMSRSYPNGSVKYIHNRLRVNNILVENGITCMGVGNFTNINNPNSVYYSKYDQSIDRWVRGDTL